MQLEQLNIEIRPRSHYEALDLGVLMARRWYWDLFWLGLFVLAPVVLLVTLLLWEHPWIALFVIWWCKPFYERLPLLYLSEVIFSKRCTRSSCIARWREALGPGFLYTLTIGRFSTSRSLDAPVLVLEKLDGEAKNNRLTLLNRRAGGAATALSGFGANVEFIMACGFLLIVWGFLPDSAVDFELAAGIGAIPHEIVWLFVYALVGAAAAFIPVYVSSGFSLYLNRRTELEAWDIEIGFRRLDQRLANVKQWAVVLAFGLLLQPLDVHSDETRLKESKAVIEDVLASDTFVETTTTRYPKFIAEWIEANKDNEVDWDWNADGAWVAVLARVLEGLLWIGLAILLVWLIMRLVQLESLQSVFGEKSQAPPKTLFGIDLTEESLPDDVVAHAIKAWEDGDQRAAFSLLLRGSLHALMTHDGCHFEEGFTEGDCLREVRASANANKASVFQLLIERWRMVAYAHRPVTDEDFATICNAWRTEGFGSV